MSAGANLANFKVIRAMPTLRLELLAATHLTKRQSAPILGFLAGTSFPEGLKDRSAEVPCNH